MFQHIAFQWGLRRLGELGSLGAALFAGYQALPEAQKGVVGRILSGEAGDITLNALWGLVAYLAIQVWSFRSTVKPQVVTEDGKQISTKKLTQEKKTYVEEAAKAAEKREPGLLERIFGKSK